MTASSVAGAAYYALFRPSTQLFGDMPFRAETPERVVALTFDDGPNEPFTSRLVDLLGDKRVAATFFQVGICVERYGGLSAQMMAAGHVIGNHSYSHRLRNYVTQPSLALDIARAQAVLTAELGCAPALFRPPYLCHPPAMVGAARRQGLAVVSGTRPHPREFTQIPAARLAQWAVARAHPGSILIFHDGVNARGGFRGQTVDAVRRVVDDLADQGYRFVTVDKLLGLPAYQA